MNRRFLQNFDWLLFILLIGILAVGLITVYSASYSLGFNKYYFYRQLLWVAIGMLLIFATLFIDYRIVCSLSVFVMIGVIILLVLTLFFGVGSSFSDSKRWLNIGGIYVQPSEFIKFAIVMVLAQHFNDTKKFGKFEWVDVLWISFLIVVPFLLIAKQPDLGTAVLYLVTACTMLYFGGIKYKIILVALLLSLVLAPIAWKYGIKEYQRDRILTLFQEEKDLLGKGYHINQSIIAVGSGGITGKGYLQGSQAQLNFLPARHTDFIFALFAEEWGFLGSLGLILLYFAFITRCLSYVAKLPGLTENCIVIGITSIIAMQVFINIGMVINLLPVVGIPLPFFSYGGSSLISSMFGVGMIMNVIIRRR